MSYHGYKISHSVLHYATHRYWLWSANVCKCSYGCFTTRVMINFLWLLIFFICPQTTVTKRWLWFLKTNKILTYSYSAADSYFLSSLSLKTNNYLPGLVVVWMSGQYLFSTLVCPRSFVPNLWSFFPSAMDLELYDLLPLWTLFLLYFLMTSAEQLHYLWLNFHKLI